MRRRRPVVRGARATARDAHQRLARLRARPMVVRRGDASAAPRRDRPAGARRGQRRARRPSRVEALRRWRRVRRRGGAGATCSIPRGARDRVERAVHSHPARPMAGQCVPDAMRGHLRRRLLALALASAACPTIAWAHQGEPVQPHDLWSAWTLSLPITLPLVATLVLYAAGTRALWARAGRGRGVRRWRVAAFVCGWLALVAALVSPLHALGEVLFSAHMAQHELLMTVAAPLLVLGRPLVPLVWSLPISWRRTAGSWVSFAPVRRAWALLTLPIAAWTLHAAAIWLWHAPPLFEATLRSELVHSLQHLSFLGSG